MSVQSIERAFLILRALSTGALGVTDIADRTGLAKSTVSRLLSALETEGAIEQLEAGGTYRLGAALGDLAGASAPGRNLVASARPLLLELTDATGETSGLSTLDDRTVYYLDHVNSEDDVQVRDWTGEHAPLHSVPSGLVILAHSSIEFVRNYLLSDLEKTTDITVTDPTEITQRLETARNDGYAWIRDEFASGITSVAAPVRDASGRVDAALHIHAPSYRFPAPGAEAEIADRVVEAARKLSALRS